jgi:hypothetical protein
VDEARQGQIALLRAIPAPASKAASATAPAPGR